MRTIAVASRKGGSGKTTVAVHLALASFLRGRQCLIADADPQRSSSTVLGERKKAGPAIVETSGPKLFTAQIAAVREGFDDLIVDTAAGEEDELAFAIVLADLTVLVVRPTFLDVAAIVRTADIIRRLGRRGLVALVQAPAARDQTEPPAVRRVLRALQFVGLPIAPTVLRQRSIYQTCFETGQSVEEVEPRGQAAAEIAALWGDVDQAVNQPI
jgi:chromosome partitioning protein